MSVATYPTAYPAATYPPGVLTGRPMEMFEVAPNLDLYAVPEQWAVGNKDTEILQELCDALDKKDDEEKRKRQEGDGGEGRRREAE